MYPTSRERQTGGESPFAISDAMHFAALQEDGTVIDSPDGPGWTTVKHTPGRAPQPFDSLTGDPSATIYGPIQPPISIEVQKVPTEPTVPDALARAYEIVERSKS